MVLSCSHPFIQQMFVKHLHVTGTVLGIRDSTVKKTNKLPALLQFITNGRKLTINKGNKEII